MLKMLMFGAFLTTLISCNGEGPKNNSDVGQIVRFEPLSVSEVESSRLQTLCMALAQKEDILSVLVSTNFAFDYAEKGCTETALPAMKEVNVTLQKNDSNYVFKKTSGDLFGFSEIETSTRGVMAKICANMSGLTNPIQTSSTGAMWFTTNTTKDKCVSDATHTCLYIQRGTVVNGYDYSIHTNEWIKFKTTNQRRGFFVERHLISSAGCQTGKVLEKKTILK